MSNVSVSRRAALPQVRAVDVLPGRVMVQRVARLVEGDVVGQLDRQLVVRHRHDAAGVAVDDRDRTAPIALARHAPVAQAPVGEPLADAESASRRSIAARLAAVDVEAVQEVGIEDRAGTDIGLVSQGESGRIGARWQHDGHDVQAVFAGEVHVALVMAGAAEDRAGAVFHQHEIGDPDRIGGALDERVPHPQARCRSRAFRPSRWSLPTCPGCGTRRRRRQPPGRVGSGRSGKRMLRRNRQEGHAVQRVRAGGVDLDRVGAVRPVRKRQPGAFGAADPVGLHEADALRPAVQRLQRVEQFLRIFGDAEEPLAELLLLDRRAGAPALAVDYLLIRQDGAVDRIPVDPAFLALDQARPCRKSRNSFCWCR